MKNSTLSAVVGLGVLVSVMSLGVYVWLFIETRATVHEVTQTAEEARLLATQNAQTQTVRRTIRDTEVERAELDSYFITEQDIVTFLADLEDLSTYSRADIQVQSVNVSSAIDKDKRAAPLDIVVQAKGSLREVFHVLSLIEELPFAVTVEAAYLKQSATEALWTGDFVLSVITIIPVKDA